MVAVVVVVGGSCLTVAALLRAMLLLGGRSLQHVGLEHLYMEMKMSHLRVVYWSVVPAVRLARFLGEAFGEALFITFRVS